MKIKGWLRRNNTVMVQAKDLARQLQEAWDNIERLYSIAEDAVDKYEFATDQYESAVDQLHRVARERDEERRLRLEAEKKHRDIVWAWSDK